MWSSIAEDLCGRDVDLRHASSCTHTHTRSLSFQTPQSTSEGGDVILSAAAPAEEAGKERAREKC